jgi:secreted trypsin-like serine protease
LTKESDCDDDAGNDCPTAVDYEIEKVTVHSNFLMKFNQPINDIALIRLKDEVRLKDKKVFSMPEIKPICLPLTASNQLFDGSNLTVIGFGFTENVTLSDSLMKADIPFYPMEKCATYYQQLNITVYAGYLCAGGGKKDSAKGT